MEKGPANAVEPKDARALRAVGRTERKFSMLRCFLRFPLSQKQLSPQPTPLLSLDIHQFEKNNCELQLQLKLEEEEKLVALLAARSMLREALSRPPARAWAET